MNLNKIASLAADECVRQGVGLDRLVMLLRGYEMAIAESKNGRPNYNTVLRIANIVEPKSMGKVRTTPVTFANGGSSAAPGSAQDALFRLFALADGNPDEWVKQFLWIHPFLDGNGRVAWVLLNWLHGVLDDPIPLPNYFGE